MFLYYDVGKFVDQEQLNIFTCRVCCSLSVKYDLLRSKTDKRSKERFLIRRNRTKRAKFRGSPLFQPTCNNNNKKQTEKQTINSTYLVSVGCGRLEEGKGHETD